jgi:hypothetical protein
MWTTMDKSSWADGPWQAEPDKEQWADEATGLPCLLKRNPLGALCGYVGVSEGHPWHGQGYSPGYSGECDDTELPPALRALDAVEVHGGLTYADSCQDGPEGETICHVAAPGEPEPLWWFGFDCAHAFDYCPGMEARSQAIRASSPALAGADIYRTADYVKAACASLAAQAAAVTAGVS